MRLALDDCRADRALACLVLAIGLALQPCSASANGMPLRPDALVAGQIVPKQDTHVRLVSERLVITVMGSAYEADARYTLSNPGSPVTIAYGVPLRRLPGEMDHLDLDNIVGSIRVGVMGQETGCSLVKSDGLDWCVASVTIPTGPRVELRLHYLSPLDYSVSCPGERSCSSHGGTLTYELAPAAAWSGKIERLQIEVRPGDMVGELTPESPPGWVERGDAFSWDLADVDLKVLGQLGLQVGSEEARRNVELMTIGSMSGLFKARASSTLPPQGRFRYDAGNVLDGDGDTAWCARHGASAGEWIELRAPIDPMPGCKLEGYFLTPGHVRDQQAWARNNHILRARLGPCVTGGQEGTEIRFTSPRVWKFAGKVLEPSPNPFVAPKDGRGEACLRLTVLEVERGRDDDTCVSKFRPVWSCP